MTNRLKRLADFLSQYQTRITLVGCIGIILGLIALAYALAHDMSPTPAVVALALSLVIEVIGGGLVLTHPDGN